MNRRVFLSAIAGLASIFGLKKIISTKKRPHTDFDYADINGPMILSKCAKPAPTMGGVRGQDCIPYLNGKPMKGVQRASAVEGWMEILVRHSVVKKLYGTVQLLWPTPERRADFDMNGITISE